jgi:hypothetical protein
LSSESSPHLHFINCHGATADPRFFGQRNSQSENYPVAHTARHLDGLVSEGTVVAAECCFERLLLGAPLGRALLEARQQFVLDTPLLHPSDLKTLAQFSLLGDPSIHPVAPKRPALEQTRVFERVVSRGAHYRLAGS